MPSRRRLLSMVLEGRHVALVLSAVLVVILVVILVDADQRYPTRITTKIGSQHSPGWSPHRVLPPNAELPHLAVEGRPAYSESLGGQGHVPAGEAQGL